MFVALTSRRFVDLYLNSQNSSFQRIGKPRNLYTAGVGIGYVACTVVYMILAQIPIVAVKWFTPITTSIQVICAHVIFSELIFTRQKKYYKMLSPFT